MYKVLVFGMTSNYGGVESVIMNYYRNFDLQKISLDFLCTDKNIAYEHEILQRGGHIYKIHSRYSNPIRYFFDINKFFKNNSQRYDCIWLNMNNLVNIDYLKLAKKYGIHRIVLHSHNSRIMESGLKGKIKGFIHRKNKSVVSNYATDFWACSKAAAKWMFPKCDLSKITIIKNAINIDNMSFDKSSRKEIRNKINANNDLIIGNIGRLSYQKNQLFLIEIFREVHYQLPNTKLIIVGSGEDEEKLKQKIQEVGLEKSVLLVGSQRNVRSWYSSFDFFLFPSRFEGLSVSLIEAQANGIPILASSNVSPKEIKINNNIFFLDLEKGNSAWADKVISLLGNKRLEYSRIKNNFISAGYDISKAAKEVQKLLIQ